MPHEYQPAVGSWYKNAEGDTFEVVAVDEATVGIQYFDGDLQELEIDDWFEMALIPVPEPEDWSGPYDNLVRDDFGDSGSGTHPEDWNGPLDDLERDEY